MSGRALQLSFLELLPCVLKTVLAIAPKRLGPRVQRLHTLREFFGHGIDLRTCVQSLLLQLLLQPRLRVLPPQFTRLAV